MDKETKTCSLTENEIKQLIIWHGYNLNDEGKVEAIEDMDERIDRINYLNRRLKAEKKDKPEDQPKVDVIAEAQKPVDTSPPTINPEPPKAATSW